MTFRSVGSALAVAMLCAAGCSSQAGGRAASEKVGASTSAIQVDGGLDTTHNFAVVICGGASKANGGECQILCSGALIAPNLVVSARHCVDNVSSDTIDCSSTTFSPPGLQFPADQYFISTDANIVNDPNVTSYQVAQIVTPTPTEFCGNDLSLLILSQNVPTSDVPVLVTPEIWYPIDSPQYAPTETAIGYGVDAPDDAAVDTAGVRRILENISIECIPGDPALPCPPVSESGVSTNEFEAGNGPCEGDSGSSAYEQNSFNEGEWLSLGVLSRGGIEGNTCVGSVYTQLYAWQSLIVSTAQQAAILGRYPAPAWTINPLDAAAADAGSLVDSSAADSGGTAFADSGTDAGGSGSGSLAPLGTTCSVEANCTSNVCVSATGDDGFVCSTACSTTAPCPSGYNCLQGFCFALPGSGQASASTGGCSVGRVAGVGSGPEGLASACGGAGLAAVVGRSRRRRRARRGRSARR